MTEHKDKQKLIDELHHDFNLISSIPISKKYIDKLVSSFKNDNGAYTINVTKKHFNLEAYST